MEIEKILKNPKFEEASKVHDWRNYVLDTYIEKWNELSFQTKQAIYEHCKEMSENEEWD